MAVPLSRTKPKSSGTRPFVPQSLVVLPTRGRRVGTTRMMWHVVTPSPQSWGTLESLRVKFRKGLVLDVNRSRGRLSISTLSNFSCLVWSEICRDKMCCICHLCLTHRLPKRKGEFNLLKTLVIVFHSSLYWESHELVIRLLCSYPNSSTEEMFLYFKIYSCPF